MTDTTTSSSYMTEITPEYMLLPKMKFKLSLAEHRSNEDLKQAFLDVIKRNNMSKYYEAVCDEFAWAIDGDLRDEMRRANADGWEKFDSSVGDPSLDDDEKACWREKLEYLCAIGDCERAASIADSISKASTSSSSTRADAEFAMFRIAYFQNSISGMRGAIERITAIMDGTCQTGSDWCCRNKLKVYEALYCLASRNFSRATSLLLDCVPTFESSELLPFDDVVRYIAISGLISLSRSDVDALVNSNGILQQALATECPRYKDYVRSLYDCRYADFFENLAWLESSMRAEPLLHRHYRYYVREMRVKAYSQLLHAYRTLGLDRMAAEFGVTERYIEQEIARFISNGRLHCKIDRVSGIVATVSASADGCDNGRAPDACCGRGVVYQNTIRKGDVLLNRLQKLGQITDF